MYNTMVGFWRKAVALLLAGAMLCGLAGCDSSETSNAESGNVSSTLTVSDNIDSSNPQSEFDFDEAVKNITLFGSKISLPCTIEDFGEDYSLREENLTTFGDVSSCGILYQGKSIGTVSLTGYKDSDNLNDKQIVSLSLGFIANDIGVSDSLKEALYESRGWYSGLIEVDFARLSFESTKAEVESVFGEPDNSGDDSADYKLYSNDRSKSVEIEFYQDKVKQITINV